MENDNSAKSGPGEAKNNIYSSQQQRGEEELENPNPNFDSVTTATVNDIGEKIEASSTALGNGGGQVQSSRRTPFTNLSQVDADLALARTLQEQERAYLMLSMGAVGSESGSWAGSYFDEDREDEYDLEEEEEEDEDVDAEGDHNGLRVEIDPSTFSSDEAFARAFQEVEERDMAARLLALAGLNGEAGDMEGHGRHLQDAWEEVDPDELSYEELLALGEVVGTENRGLLSATIASLPSMTYKKASNQRGTSTCCVICRVDYEDGETLTVLSCKHSYHSECISNWLKINKVCPVCNAEVSTTGHS